MKKTKAAFLLNVSELGDSLYFWTFTFKKALAVVDARKQWNLLLTHLRKKIPTLVGLRVFEMHQNHGLHVHVVTTRYVRVEAVRDCIRGMRSGLWGRVHVERAKKSVGPYLGKYLSKPRPECLKRWRLWAALDAKSYRHTRVADVIMQSLFASVWRKSAEVFGWEGNKGFNSRKVTAFRLMQLCIAYEVDPGFYPGGQWDLRDPNFVAWYQHGLSWAKRLFRAERPF